MAQQVIRVRYHIANKSPMNDTATFAFTYEVQGSVTTGNVQSLTDTLANRFEAAGTGGLGAIVASLHPSCNLSGSASWVGGTDITSHLGGTPAGPETAISPLSDTTLTGSSSSPPEGVAVAISWHAAYAGIPEFAPGARPRSSYRNRCYFGPLSNAVLGADANNRTVVAGLFHNQLVDWLGRVASVEDTDGNEWRVVVHSRKLAAVHPTIFMGLDDRLDYQRRRSDPGAAMIPVALPWES